MRILRNLFAVGLVLLSAGHTAARCRVAAVPPCAVELRGPAAPGASESCTSDAWKRHVAFQLPERFADANGDGWHEAVLELDLEPSLGCGCAVFRIEFEGSPTGQAVNIGDSPTNDGFGGDADSTTYDAEVMLRENGVLSVFASDRHGTPVGSEQVFGLESLPLRDAVVEIEVCDQSLRFAVEPANDGEPIGGFLKAANSEDLLGIREPTGDTVNAAKEVGADARIYASFNRVIHRRSGRPVQDRFGAGVRRVEISLTP